MSKQKSIEENLDGFLKLVDDLASLNIMVSDEDQAIQVLSSLPPQYDSLVHMLKYGNSKETLTLKEVTTSAYSKEAELREKGLLGKSSSAAEGLFVSKGTGEKRPGLSQGEEGVRAETAEIADSKRAQGLKHQQNLESAGSVDEKDISREIVLRGKMETSSKMQMLHRDKNQ